MYKNKVTILILIDGFLQCIIEAINVISLGGHNPYFNRWFSAIRLPAGVEFKYKKVTILILIDGFLQCVYTRCYAYDISKSQSLF